MVNKKLTSIVLLGLTLAGCGSRYKVCPLKYIKRSKADFVQKKNDIEVRVQKLTPKKVGKVAGGRRNASWFVPLLVTIKNTSERNVCLEDSSVDLKLVSAEEVSKHLSKKNPYPALAGIAVAPLVAVGAFVVPFLAYGALHGGGCLCGVFGALGAGALGSLVGLGACVPLVVSRTRNTTGEGVEDFNAKLSKDLNRKVVSQCCIAPQKKESALLFVRKKDLPESFDLTLIKGEEKVPFTIVLKK